MTKRIASPAGSAPIHDRCRRPGCKRARIDFHHSTVQPDAISRQLFREGRRRAAVGQPVLITVPRTSDAAVDDPPLAKRTLLVRAQVRQCANLPAVTKDGDALAMWGGDDARGLVRNGVWRPDNDPSVLRRF